METAPAKFPFIFRVGTAGWQVPKNVARHFPEHGTHLQRYAQRFNAVEINSSFYRSHARATYARWAGDTPGGFRFSVKLPRIITHERRLQGCEDLIAKFSDETTGLGERLGVVLVQLPPSAVLDHGTAEKFFAALVQSVAVPVVCEARHGSWFTPQADTLLARHRVGRVGADPPRIIGGAEPVNNNGVSYWRLHGSPQIYHSRYGPAALAEVAAQMRQAGQGAWCIFDNTAEFAAAENALKLNALLGEDKAPESG